MNRYRNSNNINRQDPQDPQLAYLKKDLLCRGLINHQQAKTLKRANISLNCGWCQQVSRCARVDCCEKIICMHCLDNLVDLGCTNDDTKDTNNKKDTNDKKDPNDDFLFICPLCKHGCSDIEYLST